MENELSPANPYFSTPIRIEDGVNDSDAVTKLQMETAIANAVTVDIKPEWVEVTTDRELQLNDIGKILYNRGSSDVVITIPTDATLDLSEDVAFTSWNEGTGLVKFVPASGVTAPSSSTKTPFKGLTYLRRGTNNWVSIGEFDTWDFQTYYLLDPSLVTLYSSWNLIGSNNVPVSSWIDEVGTSNANQSTVGNQPQLNVVSSEKEILFDGIDDSLLIGTPADLNFIPGVDSFSIVIKFGSNQGTKGTILGKSTATPATRQFNLYWASSTIMMLQIGGVSKSFSPTIMGNDFMIITVSPTESNVWWNGEQVVTSQAVGTATNTEGWMVGARTPSSPANYFDGALKTIAFYNEVLGTAKITQINLNH